MVEDLIRDILEEEEKLVKKMITRCKQCSRKCAAIVKETPEE